VIKEEDHNTGFTVVDPPRGWKYGFPAPLEKDYEAQLRKAGYPPDHIQYALKNSRYRNYG